MLVQQPKKVSNQRLERLEAIRGFAALYVVLFHVLPQKFYLSGINVGFLFRFGPEAVIVFFVLSGFVIRYTWEKSTDKSFGYYFIRRFIRLYVPLLFIFLLGYLLKCYREGGLASPEWKHLIGNLFMLQDVISQKPHVIVPAYLGNGVLWSLSYEWWFYMLFYVVATRIDKDKLNRWVSILTLTAALSYLIYPFIVNRLLMYFAIWWIGVRFAEIYLEKGSYTLKALGSQAWLMLALTLILAVNFFLHRSASKSYSYPLVAYPFIELRHFIFAGMVMTGAILWKKFAWIGFDWVFGWFKYLAPCSYAIYIAHHYLVVEATYLKFLKSPVLEYALYILVLIGFSFFLEVFLYNRIRKRILG
jgi:peptidoglycan/LPS O-acetylase OafA/YrhL